mmetsp:Transcript_16890/g.32687  ORF Transcript_16890/g.32687 Transcript_16890/m.32687 type:complete len:160 (+) Transcript_16890:1271-1750(+)
MYGRFDIGGVGAPPLQGLRTLSTTFLQAEMLAKSTRIQRSNWSLWPLSTKQLQYAALDAWVGRAVFDELGRRNPETFSPDAARALVAKQRTMEDLVERQQMRKMYKLQLKEQLAVLHDETTSQNVRDAAQASIQKIRKNKRRYPEDGCLFFNKQTLLVK